ncbi:hypothetical protein [Ruminococcus sp. XPD3002]|jgi:hypothetical protein|uniref:hypothetical protein n=1 Tax=Ruminococcus sp. XPD3002 TaxID=1452269 RepID=UPI000915E65F|nr:hypothetical protein SAMN04487832_10542 [Ruminococcus flavefaciens]HRU97406.1 hypothetical protein [Ruminococcus sp.]
MAFRGAVGIITSFPNHNEKHCVGCEHWKGERDITYGGTAATSKNGSQAFCVMRKNNTLPDYGCNNFKKWTYLK